MCLRRSRGGRTHKNTYGEQQLKRCSLSPLHLPPPGTPRGPLGAVCLCFQTVPEKAGLASCTRSLAPFLFGARQEVELGNATPTRSRRFGLETRRPQG